MMKFPKDSFPHNSVIEWWYFNGNLYDKLGKRYAFMNCLFKADPKKTSIPLVENIPSKEVFFSHSVLSDVSRKKTVTKTHPLSIISKDSFRKKNLFINYLNPSATGYVNNEIIEVRPGVYKIKDEFVDLILTSRKKPFLHHGNGYFSLKGKKVYYYSYTDMEAKGNILINGKQVAVQGKAWMDHEWANFAGEKNWNWFSIQLDDGTEMMVQEYNNRENVYVGIDSKKSTEFTEDLILVPKREWKSPLTGAKYPVEWDVFVPSKNILLKVKAPADHQEILFGSLNYWEGPIDISGTIRGKKVRGKGFMELTGRKMEANKIKLYNHQLKKEAGFYLDLAKKEAMYFWKNMKTRKRNKR